MKTEVSENMKVSMKQNMKSKLRFTALVLAAAMLLCFVSGCSSNSNVKNLMENVSEGTTVSAESSASGKDAALAFSFKLFQASLEEGENTLISPVSVLFALSMCANGASGNTLSEMESVLGTNVNELNAYLSECRKSFESEENGTVFLANSVWMKEDERFTVNREFLQKNADYYDAGIFEAPFDTATKDAINSWVKKHTNDMIDSIVDKIPEDAVMYLVNALAFDAEWSSPYYDYQVQDGTFTESDGSTESVKYLTSLEDYHLSDENTSGLLKYYDGGRYAFMALLPKEGTDIDEYASSLTAEKFTSLLESRESAEVDAWIPKFEAEFDTEMSESLKALGMVDAFDSDNADFSVLGTYENGNIYVSRVLHKTYLAVNELGTKAGAATAVEITEETALESMANHYEVHLDRPFVYALVDCESGLPLFIGVLESL